MMKIILIALLAFILGFIVWHIVINKEYQREKPIVHNAIVGGRDSQRKADINGYFATLKEYASDHQGKLPDGITEKTQLIKKGEADLCSVFVGKYFATMPFDPGLNIVGGIENCDTPYDTGYTISRDATGKITISAPHAETGPISVTKDLSE